MRFVRMWTCVITIAVMLMSALFVPTRIILAQSSVTNIRTMAWRPDGAILAAGGILADQAGIWFYDVNGQMTNQINASANVLSVSWSPDGTKVAARVSGEADMLYIWDVATENILNTIEQPGATDDRFAYWHPDGNRIATVQGRNVFIWDALTGNLLGTLPSPGSNPDSIKSLAWNLDGTKLFTASSDDVVRVWDVAAATLTTTFQQSYGVTSMALSLDGTRLAVGSSDRMVRILNATTGTLLSTHQGSSIEGPRGVIWYLDWHPSGNQIASASFGTILVWDLALQQVVTAIPQPENSFPRAMDYSPDGVRFAYMGEDGEVQIIPAPEIPTPTPTDTPTGAEQRRE